MNKIKFPLLTPEYLRQRWVLDGATREEIAAEAGCSVGNVMKRIVDWKCFRRGEVKQSAWNAGLTKETDVRVANAALLREGEGNPMYGKKAWNAGVSAKDDPRVAKIVKAMREGYDTPQTRLKMAAAKVGIYGEGTNRWKGGTTKSGVYSEQRCTVDGRRIYVHRHVAETLLRRSLLTVEHVHHIDRHESNNAPENLLVLADSDHSILHGAIYRGECDSREEQIAWLVEKQITFEVLT